MHPHGAPTPPAASLTAAAAQSYSRAVLQAVPLGVCTVDATGRIIALNPEAERLLGWGEAACCGMALHDVMACWLDVPESPCPICPITHVLQTGRPAWAADTTIQCRDGSCLPVEYTCMPLHAVDNTGAVVSFRDLRRQRQTEDDLLRLASVSEDSPLPIIELAAEARITYANPVMIALMAQYGFNQDALPAILPAGLGHIVRECLLSGQGRQGLEGNAAGKDFAWTFCPIPQAGLVRGYGIDLSERRQAEQALREARDAVLEAWRLKSEFMANISHELRTPLNGIIGMTELVLDSALTPQQHADLKTVREAADTLLALVGDLLDFSRLETGKLTLQTRAFSLRQQLALALQPLVQRAHHKGLTLTTRVTPEVDDRLLGDPDRLCQVIVSLVNNAMKFTARGGITLQGTLEAQAADAVTLHWTVTDTGIGIAEGQRHLIFEAFRQGDGSSTRLYGGIGLGLTIAAQLVTMMGGDIWVESAGPGTGSTFHCTTRFGVQAAPMLQSAAVRGA